MKQTAFRLSEETRFRLEIMSSMTGNSFQSFIEKTINEKYQEYKIDKFWNPYIERMEKENNEQKK